MAFDILIVDDETDIRDLVSGILEDEGHTTRLARDSDEALEAIENRRPALIVLDIWLQGSRLDGLEVRGRWLRQEAHTRGLFPLQHHDQCVVSLPHRVRCAERLFTFHKYLGSAGLLTDHNTFLASL